MFDATGIPVIAVIAVVWLAQRRATRMGMTPADFSWRRLLRGNR